MLCKSEKGRGLFVVVLLGCLAVLEYRVWKCWESHKNKTIT